MGSLTRKFANNFTTGGVYKAAAINNASLSNVTAIPAAAKGKLTLISSATASASASISFTSGIDSTYHTYVFKFVNMHPATNDVAFRFQGSTDGGSNYGVTITSTAFAAQHSENDVEAAISYLTASDLAQSTNFQPMGASGNDNDQNTVGILHLFNPSSTTYVKHWLATTNFTDHGDASYNRFYAGYFNTTSAINAVQFQFSSGNIDDGTIYMYGIGA